MRVSLLACLLVLGCALPGAVLAGTVRHDHLRAIDQRTSDDPRGAISFARERLAEATGPADSFWPLLGLARAQNMLERRADAGRTLADASAALDRWPRATPAHRAWLELVRLQTSWSIEEPRRARERMILLQRQVAAADDALPLAGKRWRCTEDPPRD